MITKLTQTFINNNLQCPGNKSRIEFCDQELPGLYVEVRATSQGQGTYYLRYKDANTNTKTCHQKIARTTDISLQEARNVAKQLKSKIVALGFDPRAEERARKAVLTFEEFFEQHYLPYAKPRKRSWKRDDELYRLRIKKAFGQKKLNQITRQQVQSFHTALKEEGLAAATCNHHIKLLKHCFNLAIDWGYADTNPISRVPLFHEDNKVEHYLSDQELASLLHVLRTDTNRCVCNIALLLLATGCRLNEVLRAKWADVDLEKGVFIVRAQNSKSKRLRAVPLNDTSLELLKQLDMQQEYLFMNRQTGKPYTTITKVWDRLRKSAGLPHLRLHDLRHQFASFLVNDGRTLYEVQQILGHSDPKVTMRYAHLSTKALREAANSAAVKIRG